MTKRSAWVLAAIAVGMIVIGVELEGCSTVNKSGGSHEQNVSNTEVHSESGHRNLGDKVQLNGTIVAIFLYDGSDTKGCTVKAPDGSEHNFLNDFGGEVGQYCSMSAKIVAIKNDSFVFKLNDDEYVTCKEADILK